MNEQIRTNKEWIEQFKHSVPEYDAGSGMVESNIFNAGKSITGLEYYHARFCGILQISSDVLHLEHEKFKKAVIVEANVARDNINRLLDSLIDKMKAYRKVEGGEIYKKNNRRYIVAKSENAYDGFEDKWFLVSLVDGHINCTPRKYPEFLSVLVNFGYEYEKG